MRLLILLACSLVALAALAWSSAAAEPRRGLLSVEGGRGTVVLDIRGSVLGRLGSGTLRVIDLTPNDRFSALVVGRKLSEDRLNSRAVQYKGQGLRFRMLGGAYRIIARGNGISLSAVGRGAVTLEGDRKVPTDDAGVYSLEGVDCGDEPELCIPLPDDPERFVLGPSVDEGEKGTRSR